jgi:hypothetical protein
MEVVRTVLQKMLVMGLGQDRRFCFGFSLAVLAVLCLLGRYTLPLEPPLNPLSFHFGDFWDRVSNLYPGHPGSQSSYLCFPCSWDDRHVPHPAFYWLRWGLANLLPRLASNHDPPDFHLPSSWGHRCGPCLDSPFTYMLSNKYIHDSVYRRTQMESK